MTGKLTNADTDTMSYSGNISAELNDRNRLDFDVTKITSRRGLVYFGFPFQRDRLNHDTLNLGLNWRSQLSPDLSSILNTTISYNQDYFNTFWQLSQSQPRLPLGNYPQSSPPCLCRWRTTQPWTRPTISLRYRPRLVSQPQSQARNRLHVYGGIRSGI